MRINRHCARAGCRRIGTAQPVLLLAPRRTLAQVVRRQYEGVRAEAGLVIAVCPEHQAGAAAADFISDEGWALIVAAFARVGRQEPDRASAALRWDPLP